MDSWTISESAHGGTHARIQRGGGFPDHHEKSQNIGFLSNTGPDPLKNHKTTKSAFNVGPSSDDGQLIIVVLGSSLPQQIKKVVKSHPRTTLIAYAQTPPINANAD